MNQDEVKKTLLQVHDCAVEFTLVFSGKKSKRVNGLYNWDTREIIIHNRNFSNDSLLMFTAIHEMAHHILFTEMGGGKINRGHSQTFWATFYGLVDKAEAMGVYQPIIDNDTQKLIEEARDISNQIASLQRKLGKVLDGIVNVCQKKGLRAEDMIERKAQISKKTMEASIAASRLDLPENVSVDIQQEAVRQKNVEKRAAIVAAGTEGKSVAQAKQAAAPVKSAAPPAQEDETVSLIKEKRRPETTIEKLTHRLEELEERLESRKAREDMPPFKESRDDIG
jgi:Zn-dependent peptidase ImmA (M78 family)